MWIFSGIYFIHIYKIEFWGYITSQSKGLMAHKIFARWCLNMIDSNINPYYYIMNYKEKLVQAKDNLQLDAFIADISGENSI